MSWLLLLPVLLLAWTLLVAVVGWAVQAAELGQPVHVEARTMSLVVREGAARALLRLLGPLGWGQPLPPRAAASVKEKRLPPVLVLPGATWGRASLMFLRRFLISRGWRWVWTLNRASRDAPLATEAEQLARRVRELKQASGAAQIDIVGFSAGGLIAAWYLRHHPEARDSVRRLVTLAAPWRGTRMAVFGRQQAARELIFGSHLLDDLWPPPVPTVCIWSADDPLVVPAASAAPEGASETVCIEAAGHVELLVSARAFRAVQAALEHPLAEPASSSAQPAPTLVPEVLA